MSFSTQLTTLKKSFSSALDNFHNTYIIHHTNPDSTEYTQIYLQDKGQITSINTSLFSLKNSVQVSIDALNKQIALLNVKLKREKGSNDVAHKKLGQKKGKSLGSKELIIETQEMYYYQRIKNVTLLIGDVVLLYLIYKLR